MYFVYVLLFKTDGRFYIGFSSDLKKRLEMHRNSGVDSTKHRGSFLLAYYEACLDKNDAQKREKYFKSGFGRRFLNNRLENYLNGSGSRWRAGAYWRYGQGGTGNQKNVSIFRIPRMRDAPSW